MVRRAIVYATIAFCVAVTAFDIAAHVEQWPFSHYPMYAGRAGRTFSMFRLYVAGERGETPIALEGLPPFTHTQLSAALARILRSRDAKNLQAALRDCLRIYRETQHDPTAGSIRLYEVTWIADPLPAPPGKPVSRTLLAAYEEAR